MKQKVNPLLEAAFNATKPKVKRDITKDHVEVAVAWVDGTVSSAGAAAAFNVSISQVYQKLAMYLREGCQNGMLDIRIK